MPFRFSCVKDVTSAMASWRSRKYGNMPRAMKNAVSATAGSGSTTQAVSSGDMSIMK